MPAESINPANGIIDYLAYYELQGTISYLALGIIAGTWAIIKQFHDYKLKKGEAVYSHFLDERSDALDEFISAYNAMKMLVLFETKSISNGQTLTQSHYSKHYGKEYANLMSTGDKLAFYFEDDDRDALAALGNSLIRAGNKVSDVHQGKSNIVLATQAQKEAFCDSIYQEIKVAHAKMKACGLSFRKSYLKGSR